MSEIIELLVKLNDPKFQPIEQFGSARLRRIAKSVCSESIQAETLGGEIASRLSKLSPKSNVANGFKMAAEDEKYHADFFRCYQRKYWNETDSQYSQDIDILRDELLGDTDFSSLAAKHAALEAMATVEFDYLSKLFDTTILGEGYSRARIDELRHVRLGVSVVRRFPPAKIEPIIEFIFFKAMPPRKTLIFFSNLLQVDYISIYNDFKSSINDLMRALTVDKSLVNQFEEEFYSEEINSYRVLPEDDDEDEDEETTSPSPDSPDETDEEK
ncbi:hypothetical protein [Pseudoteredinibacter isoporae]|uniref:hypothetical protein n=1 Tax=Pseudoteredinibacter isoporae TaxID=570281 RepID=UPI00310AA00C